MAPSPKKKLCWNCEGRVSLSEENCPYCAVYLGPAPDDKGANKDILAPPYRIVESEEESVPGAPYAAGKAKETGNPEESENTTELSSAKSDLKQVVLPLGLLSAGVLFCLFGIILYFFSEHGEFSLTWNADYWYFYLMGSMPLLILGWWALKKFEEEGVTQ